MISEIFVKIAAIVLLAAVAVVLILGIRTLFKGDGDKKTSNKLMQLRVLLPVSYTHLTLPTTVRV